MEKIKYDIACNSCWKIDTVDRRPDECPSCGSERIVVTVEGEDEV